jgi:hypothetical protein|tara:strand:+ start:189 stop:413 length:225 start_codon:yes stop_codon:yes gene_type:complete
MGRFKLNQTAVYCIFIGDFVRNIRNPDLRTSDAQMKVLICLRESFAQRITDLDVVCSRIAILSGTDFVNVRRVH